MTERVKYQALLQAVRRIVRAHPDETDVRAHKFMIEHFGLNSRQCLHNWQQRGYVPKGKQSDRAAKLIESSKRKRR